MNTLNQMETRAQAVEKLFVDHASLMMKDVQFRLDGPYINDVVMGEWPKAAGFTKTEFIAVPLDSAAEDFGYTERTYSLRNSAINSPDICLYDFVFQHQVKDQIETVVRLMTENLRWLWKTTFRRDIINAIQNRTVMQAGTLRSPFLADPFPRAVNFFGKEVSVYSEEAYAHGKLWRINPKYKRAAKQFIEFHPDIVHFLFPDREKWAGEMAWKNIPSYEHNPDSCIGNFRAIMTYAARPVRPDLGRVITETPPGIIGTLWYWAWKLVGFIP